MKRLKILVSAFAISPLRGSEFGVGWNVVTRLAKYHDITVLYGDINRDDRSRRDIDQWIADNGPIEGVTFCYVSPNRIGCFLDMIAQRIKPLIFVYYWAYRCWQKQAYLKAKELLEKETYDATHLLTFIGFRDPGYLWKLPLPFFWGPINGADNIPWAYFSIFGFNAQARYFIRNVINSVQRLGSISVRKAAHKAAAIWVVSDDDYKMVTDVWRYHATYMAVTGTTTNGSIDVLPRKFSGHRPLRLVWSGLFEGRKALPLLLRAISKLSNPTAVRLTILGDGPEGQRWKALAEELKIKDLITWSGRLPLSEAQSLMAKSDIFILTSIKEGTPTVLMEALSCGLPVICHEACGMKHVVDESCGILVPMCDPDKSVVGFANAIQRFIDDPDLLEILSAGSVQKIREFSWDENVARIASAYKSEMQKNNSED